MPDASSVSNRESKMLQSQINWKLYSQPLPIRSACEQIHALHPYTLGLCIEAHNLRCLINSSNCSNKRFVLTFGPNWKAIWNGMYIKTPITWIMIYWRFCCNQWGHTLAGGVEFHFAYIVTTIFAWKHLLITLEIPWKKFSVVENAAFLCGYSTHFEWWQINVFRFLTHYTFGHVYSAQKWLSKYKSI